MTQSPLSIDQPLLALESSIAFCGSVRGGLKTHPDKKHLIYSIGCTVVIENITSGKQEFLSAHTKNVSCLAVSKSGNYIASGQVTDTGFKADIIIWNFEERRASGPKLTLHRNSVEALAFSPNDKYLVSLGGQDDGSIVVWNIANNEAVCGSPAQMMSAGLTTCLAYSNTSDDVFISGGDGTLRVWTLNIHDRKIRPVDVQLGQMKRVVTCIEVGPEDKFFYCGTTTGDVLSINMKSHNLQTLGPEKARFCQGITSLVLLPGGELLVGAGDGTVAVLKGADEKFKITKKKKQVDGMVTSLALRGQGHQFYVGTSMSNMYKFDFGSFNHELKMTCNYDRINDLAMPYGSSELLVTASTQDIRVWFIPTNKEMLRIRVANMTCNAVDVTRDGTCIVTGWNDAKVRGFSPETGKRMWIVQNAGGSSVTALSCFPQDNRVITGSNRGHIMVWTVTSSYVTKHMSMKEHTAEITCIRVQENGQKAVSSCMDGTCIIWDIANGKREKMIRMNTLFKYSLYHPDENQILATGTDRKITYWEAHDGTLIRELEGSSHASVNAMDISADGAVFVSGGDDKLVKVWKYDEGVATHVGVGHSAPITGIKICPNKRHIISISADGAILKWATPFLV